MKDIQGSGCRMIILSVNSESKSVSQSISDTIGQSVGMYQDL
jgi:hypothetical protein